MTAIYLSYIVGIPALTAIFCAIVPKWGFRDGDLVTGILAIFLFFCWLMGGAIGFFIPQWLAIQYGDGTLGALGRTAQVVGAPCGFIIALRGSFLFATLGLLTAGVGGIISLGIWVING